jgi:hypothetical protein
MVAMPQVDAKAGDRRSADPPDPTDLSDQSVRSDRSFPARFPVDSNQQHAYRPARWLTDSPLSTNSKERTT